MKSQFKVCNLLYFYIREQRESRSILPPAPPPYPPILHLPTSLSPLGLSGYCGNRILQAWKKGWKKEEENGASILSVFFCGFKTTLCCIFNQHQIVLLNQHDLFCFSCLDWNKLTNALPVENGTAGVRNVALSYVQHKTSATFCHIQSPPGVVKTEVAQFGNL